MKDKFERVSKRTKAVLGRSNLEVIADRGYFKSEDILACHEANITVTLPKPRTSSGRLRGRFVKQDFRYIAENDIYLCPAGEELTYRFSSEEKGLTMNSYWSDACGDCSIKDKCTTGAQRHVKRWRHEHLLEAVEQRLDEHPEKMRQRRETVEHSFGTAALFSEPALTISLEELCVDTINDRYLLG